MCFLASLPSDSEAVDLVRLFFNLVARLCASSFASHEMDSKAVDLVLTVAPLLLLSTFSRFPRSDSSLAQAQLHRAVPAGGVAGAADGDRAGGDRPGGRDQRKAG